MILDKTVSFCINWTAVSKGQSGYCRTRFGSCLLRWLPPTLLIGGCGLAFKGKPQSWVSIDNLVPLISVLWLVLEKLFHFRLHCELFFHFYMLFLQFLNAIKCSDIYGTYNTTYIYLLLQRDKFH